MSRHDDVPGRCFAADTAIACERPAEFRFDTADGIHDACARHVRLLERRLERMGLATTITVTAGEPPTRRPAPVGSAA